jgi:hypothetical protein
LSPPLPVPAIPIYVVPLIRRDGVVCEIYGSNNHSSIFQEKEHWEYVDPLFGSADFD